MPITITMQSFFAAVEKASLIDVPWQGQQMKWPSCFYQLCLEVRHSLPLKFYSGRISGKGMEDQESKEDVLESGNFSTASVTQRPCHGWKPLDEFDVGYKSSFIR